MRYCETIARAIADIKAKAAATSDDLVASWCVIRGAVCSRERKKLLG
jgi:hypothetical protein